MGWAVGGGARTDFHEAPVAAVPVPRGDALAAGLGVRRADEEGLDVGDLHGGAVDGVFCGWCFVMTRRAYLFKLKE